MISEDDDDPVVDEIPVFLTHDYQDKLFVLQFPTQPFDSHEKHHVVKSQIKPENQELVLEFSLDTQNPNYDKSQGEQLALNVDKDKPASSRVYPRQMIDRIKYESKRAQINCDNYAVGILNNRRLILSPIKGMVSMHPTFNHLSQQEAASQEEEKVNEEGRLVHAHFSQAESERAKKAREASYNYYREKTSNERWYFTKYHDSSSPLSQLEKSGLCRVADESCNDPKMEFVNENYLELLIPKEAEMAQELPDIPDHLTSINSLKELGEPDQIRKVLDQVKVVGAIQLSWLLTIDLDKVVQYLQTCAVLVLGNWVLRSDLLYKSPHNGIPPDIMANARDYILHEFHQGKTLERKNLGNVIALPFEEVKEIMSEVGVLKRNKLWHFRLQTDEDFIKRYPEVVEQQNLLWKARMRDIEERLGFATPSQVPVQSQRRRNNSESSTASNQSPARRRKNSSVSSDDSSETTSVVRRRNRKKSETKSVTFQPPNDIKVKEEPS